MYRFGEPRELIDSSYEELILNGQSLHNHKPSLYGRFGEVFKHPELATIPQEQILVFTEDKNAIKPVTINIGYPPKSFCWLISAAQGGGKSGLVKALMDMLFLRGFKFLCLEPKGFDFVTMNIPQDDPRAFDVLKRFGLKPKAYHLASAIPSFIEDPFIHATPYKLDVADFNSLPKLTRWWTWSKFLGIEELSNPGKALQRVLSMSATDEKGRIQEGPKNINQMIDFTGLDIEQERAKRRGQGAPPMVSTSLLYLLQQKIMTNELGVGMPYNFVKAMVQNDMLILHTPFDSKNISSMNTYISVAINQLIQDRTIYIKTNHRKGNLTQPIVVVVEEADALIAKGIDNLAKHILYSIPARFRHIGISLILITQNPGLIDDKFVRLCNLIFTTQVNSPEQIKLMGLRGVPRFLVENKLKRLDWSVEHPTKEWGILDIENVGEVKTGYPIWPCTKLLKQGEGLSPIPSLV